MTDFAEGLWIDPDYEAQVWRDYLADEEIRIAKEEASNNRMFKLIERMKGKKWLKDFQRLLDDCECNGIIRLSRRTGGDPQKESGFGEIKQIWVYQTTLGDISDAYHGTIWVQIKKGRWLEIDFAC